MVVAGVHEAALLLLAAALLWSAAGQLRALGGWTLWSVPLFGAMASSVVGAVMAWIGTPARRRWRRMSVWGALAVASPVAMAAMTSIDFSALAACQLLLVAGCVSELSARARVVIFVWLAPAAVTVGLFLYHATL